MVYAYSTVHIHHLSDGLHVTPEGQEPIKPTTSHAKTKICQSSSPVQCSSPMNGYTPQQHMYKVRTTLGDSPNESHLVSL